MRLRFTDWSALARVKECATDAWWAHCWRSRPFRSLSHLIYFRDQPINLNSLHRQELLRVFLFAEHFESFRWANSALSVKNVFLLPSGGLIRRIARSGPMYWPIKPIRFVLAIFKFILLDIFLITILELLHIWGSRGLHIIELICDTLQVKPKLWLTWFQR